MGTETEGKTLQHIFLKFNMRLDVHPVTNALPPPSKAKPKRKAVSKALMKAGRKGHGKGGRGRGRGRGTKRKAADEADDIEDFMNRPVRKKPVGSYYKIINGQKYDRELLEQASAFASKGLISEDEMKDLWEQAEDGPGITEIEHKTFMHILKSCASFLSKGAIKFLKRKLGTPPEQVVDVADAESDGNDENAGQEEKDADEEGEDHEADDAMEGAAVVKKPAINSGGSYYKCIDGEKYDRELMEEAEALSAKGPISEKDVRRLWENAEDGPGVTKIEAKTLQYILENTKLSPKAAAFLKAKLKASGKSYYRVIDGIKYDRDLLEQAKMLGTITDKDAKLLWEDAEDGPGVTETEARTLQYILDNSEMSPKAAAFLKSKLNPALKSLAQGRVITNLSTERNMIASFWNRPMRLHRKDRSLKKPWSGFGKTPKMAQESPRPNRKHCSTFWII